MSEFEAFTAMLKRAGIVFTEQPGPSDLNVPWASQCVMILRIDQDYNSSVNIGYTSFYTELFWDADGQLLGMGAWE